MTNELSVEEAVELLKEKRFEINCQVNGTTQFSKALDMAIKALEQIELNPSYNGVKTELEPCVDWYDVPSDEMTLEQARQAVKDLRKKLAEYLEQQPCEDCVSREQALDAMDTWDKFGYTEKGSVVRIPKMKGDYVPYVRYDDMVKCIKNLPAVKPQQKWIPVSERLPEENEIVIASAKYGVYPEARYTKEGVWEWAYESGADYWKELDNVEAWMPLPEPYKEGSNGE